MKKPDRNEIIANLIQIYIEVIAFFDDEEKASINEHTRVAMDFKIACEDLELALREMERHFSVKIPDDDWRTVLTLGDIADLIIKYNGYITKPYSLQDCKPEYPEWMKKIGYFFKWLFGQRPK